MQRLWSTISRKFPDSESSYGTDGDGECLRVVYYEEDSKYGSHPVALACITTGWRLSSFTGEDQCGPSSDGYG